MRGRRPDGFSLIELLVTVAILGIVMAIAIINYRSAIDRSRQRRSMSDMRSLATGFEAYATDHNRYPPPAGFVLPPGLALPTESLEATRPYLQPTYLRNVPVTDGWNSWFLYGTTADKTDYAIRSAGREGVPEASPVYGPTSDFRDDIILVNGQFVQWPEGVQR